MRLDGQRRLRQELDIELGMEFLAKEMIEKGERSAKLILEAMIKEIEKEPLAKIDYVKAVDLATIQQTDYIKGEVLIAIAVYIGKTRLIDNIVVNI